MLSFGPISSNPISSQTTLKTYNEIGSGGIVCGGSSESAILLFGSGGVVCGGEGAIYNIFNPLVIDGVVVNGSGIEQIIYNLDATGGVVASGSAESSVFISGSGGTVCGGIGLEQVLYNPEATGGTVCGGIGLEQVLYNPEVSGGVVCGGVGLEQVLYNPEVSGGVVCGGVGLEQVLYNPEVSGGAVCGGTGNEHAICSPVVTGGGIVNGISFNFVEYNPGVTGGGIVNGEGGVGSGGDGEEVGSGGAVVGGTGYVSVFRRYQGHSGTVVGGSASESLSTAIIIYPDGIGSNEGFGSPTISKGAATDIPDSWYQYEFPLPVVPGAPVPSQADYSQRNVAWLIEFLAFCIGEQHTDIALRYENNTPNDKSDDIIVSHPNDKLYWPEAHACNFEKSAELLRYEQFAKNSARLRLFEENSPADIKYFQEICP